MSQPSFSEEELSEYKLCPDVAIVGGHIGGFKTCIFCAEIYRRYRSKEGNLVTEDTLERKREEPAINEKSTKEELFTYANDDDEECGKLECIRAGWCMCD